jgi:hypothetical protein
MISKPLRPVILAIGLMAGVSVITPALGQTTVQGASDSDLRKQNQQLQSRVQDLERELKAAQDRIIELEKKVAAGGHTAGNSGTTTTTAGSTSAEPQVSIDENVPSASPRALLRALTERYQNDPAKLEMGKDGDGKRRAYVRRLEGWKATVERELRGPIKWHAQVIGPGEPPFVNGYERVRLVAVDPVTGLQLGAPFDVSLNRTASDRLANWMSKGEADVVVVTGTLNPMVNINENRTARGSFDNPPYIGPFAEMGFDINVQSLTLPKDEVKEATTKPATLAKPVAPKPVPKPTPPPVAPGK